MKTLFHWLVHKLGWYYGTVVARWENDKLIVGFRCDTCGKVEGEHETQLFQMLFGPNK